MKEILLSDQNFLPSRRFIGSLIGHFSVLKSNPVKGQEAPELIKNGG